MTTAVVIAGNEYVIQAGGIIEDFLEEYDNEEGASRALYVLSCLAETLGRNKPEEAEMFKKEWERLKPIIKSCANLQEFLSTEWSIDELLERMMQPAIPPYIDGREISTFRERRDEILFHLED